MWNQIKVYVYGAAILAAIFLAYKGYGLYREYEEMKKARDIAEQNAQAFREEATAKAATITLLTARVENLQNDNTKLKSENLALKLKIGVLIDSIQSQGSGTTTVTGDTVEVKFEGDKGIAHYKGFTLANVKTQTSTYDLTLTFRTIDVQPSLIKDLVDGKWKLRTESLTPGVKVLGTAILDDNTFSALQKYPPPEKPRSFGLQLDGTYQGLYGGALVRPWKDLWIGGGYRLMGGEPDWYKNLKVSTFWTPF